MSDMHKCSLESIFKDIKAELDSETMKKSFFYNFNFEDEVPIISTGRRFEWRAEKIPALQLVDIDLYPSRKLFPNMDGHCTHLHQDSY